MRLTTGFEGLDLEYVVSRSACSFNAIWSSSSSSLSLDMMKNYR